MVDRPSFSPAVTWLCLAVLLSIVGFFLSLHVSTPRLKQIDEPESALALLVERSMELEEAIAAAPDWERRLYLLTVSDRETETAQAIAWYRELAAYSDAPAVALQLAVLEAEAGHQEAVRRSVRQWVDQRDPMPFFAHVLAAAYLGMPGGPELVKQWMDARDQWLSDGWFADTLTERLVRGDKDRRPVESRGDAVRQRIADRLNTVRWLVALQGIGLCVGAAALTHIVRLRNRTEWLRIGAASMPPPWRGWDGVTVLIRGGAAGGVIMLALLWVSGDDSWVSLAAIPLTNLPVCLLAQRWLLKPEGRSFTDGLGLRPHPVALRRTVSLVPLFLIAGLVVEWALGKAGDAWRLAGHWTEWFDPILVWGDGLELALSLFEYVVLAPAFEELVFRGLLFATLRRRYGWGAAGSISAGLFAVAHGYGVLGFLGVFSSGLLWAWAYEKTGSLLPGMTAHAVNNLLVCTTEMWILRE
jgi:membrane protease YdiL (CAAX protease family)